MGLVVAEGEDNWKQLVALCYGPLLIQIVSVYFWLPYSRPSEMLTIIKPLSLP